MGIPPEFVGMLTPMISQAVKQSAGFAIEDLEIKQHAQNCEEPALFLHAQGDNFVLPENSEINFNAYKG